MFVKSLSVFVPSKLFQPILAKHSSLVRTLDNFGQKQGQGMLFTAIKVGAERYVKSKPSVTINVTARIIAFLQFMEDILKPLNYYDQAFIQSYFECHYAQCRYAECYYIKCHYTQCHYAKCHYANSRGALTCFTLQLSIRGIFL